MHPFLQSAQNKHAYMQPWLRIFTQSSFRTRFCTIFTPSPDISNLRFPSFTDLAGVQTLVGGVEDKSSWNVYRWKETSALRQVTSSPSLVLTSASTVYVPWPSR
jgi:hypothetical protein